MIFDNFMYIWGVNVLKLVSMFFQVWIVVLRVIFFLRFSIMKGELCFVFYKDYDFIFNVFQLYKNYRK